MIDPSELPGLKCDIENSDSIVEIEAQDDEPDDDVINNLDLDPGEILNQWSEALRLLQTEEDTEEEIDCGVLDRDVTLASVVDERRSFPYLNDRIFPQEFINPLP